MASEAESPLSSVPSEDEMVDETATSTPARSRRPSVETQHEQDSTSQPPTKKRKTGPGGFHNWNANDRAASTTAAEPETDVDVDLSEDSEGSAPGTPSLDEHALRADQVTACQWESCPVGDLGNSDDLIKHVQDDHISPKRAKYTCEWGECARKGAVHPSGYALKAHMRSHTKEKPFFCALPECDRSFTRSDALAKHMRTVHEPEPAKQTAAAAAAAAASADTTHTTPATKKKGPTIRVNKLSTPSAAAAKTTSADASSLLDPKDPNYDPSPANDNIQYIPACHPITGQPGFMITYPPDIHFSQFESEIPANQLMRLLRRQLHWAQAETADLKAEIEELERVKREEWRKKEAVLLGVLGTELKFAFEDEDEEKDKNGDDVDGDEAVVNGDGGVKAGNKKNGASSSTTATHRADRAGLKAAMEKDIEDAKHLLWTGEPTWRKKRTKVKPTAIAAARPVASKTGAKNGHVDDDDDDDDDEANPEADADATALDAQMDVDRKPENEEDDDADPDAGTEDDEGDDAIERTDDQARASNNNKMDVVRESSPAAVTAASAAAAAAASQADVERDAIDALMGMGGGRGG